MNHLEEKGMVSEMTIPNNSSGQKVYMENREHITITGVIDVISFDDTFVEAETELGNMMIRGDGLKIEKLSLEEHELALNGYIFSYEYEDEKKSKRNIFVRMFK